MIMQIKVKFTVMTAPPPPPPPPQKKKKKPNYQIEEKDI